MTAAPGFSDWLEIGNLKARYCRLLDGKDWPGWSDLFAPDAVLDTTDAGGPRMDGRAAIVAYVHGTLEHVRTVHQVHSPEIIVDGDAARGIWAMQDRLMWPDGRTLTGYGHYHEHYTRIDGAWYIARSRLTRLLVEFEPIATVPRATV